MLTTRMTPAQIVMGKLMTALSTIAIVIVSSLPVFALVLSYGGVSIVHMLLLILAFLVTALFTASIGIWASSISSRSAMATAIAYGVLLVFVGGTAGIVLLTQTLSGDAGATVYILLANPVVTFYTIISYITGVRDPLAEITGLLGTTSPSVTPMAWFMLGILVEFVISTLLILLAIYRVKPGKK